MTDLHILNGDSISHLFAVSGILGEAFVWREALCEGQAGIDITSEKHWAYRQAYLKETYSAYEQKKFDQLKNDFQQLKPHDYGEIHLWFEYDLFCQVNMIALLAWLAASQIASEKVYLICVGTHPDYDKLVGLGELTQEQFTALKTTRQQIIEWDLQIAVKLWNQWCTGQHHKLIETSLQLDQERFPYITPALKVHIKRFPFDSTLLTEIETEILNLISAQPKTAKAIVSQLLRRENYYGFGDLQYFNIIENLKPLIREEQGLLQLISSENLGSEFQLSRNLYYGGASQQDYFYNEMTKSLTIKKQLG